MKFIQEPQSAVTIRRVSPGEIRVGDEILRTNIVLHTQEIGHVWSNKAIADLTLEDFTAHLSEQTEIVLLGTGWQPRIPPRGLVFSMARQGHGFEAMETPAACRTFNILVGEGRNVSAFLLLQ